MAKKVTWDSFFDFSNEGDIDKAIKAIGKLDSIYDQLVKDVSSGAVKLTASQKKIIDSLGELTAKSKSLNEANKADQKTIAELNSKLTVLSTTYKQQAAEIAKLTSIVTGLKAEKEKVGKASKELNNINLEAIKLEAQIGKAISQEAKEVAGLKLQLSELKKQRSLEAKEAAGLVTLYQKKSQELAKMASRYKDYVLAGQQGSKVAQKLKQDHDALRASILKADQSVGQFGRSVGNYKTALAGVTSIASAFGIATGIFLIADLIKGTFNLIKETERYSKALMQVTDSQEQYSSEMEYLIDLSNRYGVNINTLTGSYTKFFVAAKGTKISAEQTRMIFDTVTEASAKMGLTMEDTEGALKALGQMLSKNKVQAEELRSQLGDRMPGAFSIMARAMGVTTLQLDKLMKDGKVISEDVLPKFALEMQKTFNLETSNRIDTIASSQNRLTNAWIEFVRSVENGEGVIASTLKGLMDTFSLLLNAMTKSGKQADEFKDKMDAKYLSKGYILVNKELDLMNEEFKKLSKEKGNSEYLKEFQSDIDNTKLKIAELRTGEIVRLQKTLDNSGKNGNLFLSPDEFKHVSSALLKLNAEHLQFITNQEKSTDSAKNTNVSMIEASKSTSIAYRSTVLYDEAVKKGIYTNGEFENKMYDVVSAMSDSEDVFEKVGELYKENSRELNHLIYMQEKLAESTRKNAKAPLDSVNIETKSLFGEKTGDGLLIVESQFSAVEAMAIDHKTMMEGINDAITANDKANSEQRILTAEMEKERKVAIFQGIGDAIGIIGNQLFTNAQINRDNELGDFKAKKEQELKQEGISAQRKALIQKQIEKEEKKAKTEAAKAQKKQAIFNILLGTAQGLVNVWATAPAPVALVLSGIVASLGAIQLAAVASQPLPKYEKGGQVMTDGPIITSEKGREMAVTPDGRLILTNNKGAEIRNDIPKHSHIFDHNKTEKILKSNDSSGVEKMIQEQRIHHTLTMMSKMERENDMLIDAIKKSQPKEQHIWNVTDGDLKRTMKKGNTTYLNWRKQNEY